MQKKRLLFKSGALFVIFLIVMLVLVIVLGSVGYYYLNKQIEIESKEQQQLEIEDKTSQLKRDDETIDIGEFNLSSPEDGNATNYFGSRRGGGGGGGGGGGSSPAGTSSTTSTSSSTPSTQSDQTICQNAQNDNLCNGLDLAYGQGYKDLCCEEHNLCC